MGTMTTITATQALVFDAMVGVDMTVFKTIFDSRYSYPETVARLLALSGQSSAFDEWDSESAFEFRGTYGGVVFTLYERGGRIHIGGPAAVFGRSRLDYFGLEAALNERLATVTPWPFVRTLYDGSILQFKGAS